MSAQPFNILQPAQSLDYSLTGVNSSRAIEKGLAEADWYQCHVPREKMRALLERKDGPALRDTFIWFSSIAACTVAAFLLRHTFWFVVPYLAYCALYASTSDSRWHEAGHGTAFRSDWLNSALYEIASFMIKRESTVWRWSHTRHHSDTLIVGRDPEIAVPRPPDVRGIILGMFSLKSYPKYAQHILLHARGEMTAEERTYIPESEFPKIYLRARVYVAIYTAVFLASILLHSWIPILLVVLPNLFGSWLMVVYGLTQHAGLAENVLDHRLNCRTVYMNPIHRFLYWNMNYHVEHHMFPLVPYHALPALHDAVKDDCPTPYGSLYAAWREIIPAVRKQLTDHSYHVKRRLPERSTLAAATTVEYTKDAEGWIDCCAPDALKAGEVMRIDQGRKTYALYRTGDGRVFATDGICTHGNMHLAEGLVIGQTIECPKHNGRFNLSDGSPARVPICRGLATYPVEERDGRIKINVQQPGGAGARATQAARFRVVSNRNVATFIKELVLAPVDAGKSVAWTPGDYMQFEIPAYGDLRFDAFDIPEPFAQVWKNQHVFDLVAHNDELGRRNNYSVASNSKVETNLRLNVRIATPPPGQECSPGVGSSYLFSLKPGDVISAIGPFGDFHVKPNQREMIYIGGGAGMAPIRAHISHLMETEKSHRRISFWYGGRSRQELFYSEFFEDLAAKNSNFSFHLALSDPQPSDGWSGYVGFVHEVVLAEYLRKHANPNSVDFYLCGPPMMVKACNKMLASLGVKPHQIAYDEF